MCIHYMLFLLKYDSKKKKYGNYIAMASIDTQPKKIIVLKLRWA